MILTVAHFGARFGARERFPQSARLNPPRQRREGIAFAPPHRLRWSGEAMEAHPYRQTYAARDIDGLIALLADDVVFHSPVIANPAFEGRASVAELHTILFDEITDAEYTLELGDETIHFLVADG